MKIRRGLPASLLLGAVVVVFLAPGGQALTLVSLEGDAGHVQMRVRLDEGVLHARSVNGSIALDGPGIGSRQLDERAERIDAERHRWRGFENVSRLEAKGQGRLLIFDGASGLVVDVSSPPEQTGANQAGGDEATASSREDDGGPADGNASAPSPSEPRQDLDGSGAGSQTPGAGPPGHRPEDGAGREANPPAEGPAFDDAGDEGGLPTGEPVVVALGLLALGAFAVERFTARGGGEDA